MNQFSILTIQEILKALKESYEERSWSSRLALCDSFNQYLRARGNIQFLDRGCIVKDFDKLVSKYVPTEQSYYKGVLPIGGYYVTYDSSEDDIEAHYKARIELIDLILNDLRAIEKRCSYRSLVRRY